MDGDEHRRQQYGTSYQIPGAARPSQTQSMPPPPIERFAQPSQSPARVDIPRTSVSRSYVPSYGSYGYQEQQYATPSMQSSPMQGVEMQYAQGYVHDAARAQQMQQQSPHQQYETYGQSVMLPPGPSQAIYDTVPHFQQRQAAAVEVLSTQFGVPQYLPSNGQGTIGPAGSSQQFVTTQAEETTFPQQMPVSRSEMQQQQTYPTAAAEFPAIEEQDAAGAQEAEAARETLNEGVRQYQEQLKLTFGLIKTARVSEASEKLVELSRWLISSVTALDLHHDKPEEHESRIDLWRDFNLCWEALGQKQKIITQEALRTRRQPADVLRAVTIHKMVNELISMCDQIEPHGLVDYDMGIWEEQILNIFIECLDILPPEESGEQASSSASQPSAVA